MASAPTSARVASFTREAIAASGISWDEKPSSDAASSVRRPSNSGRDSLAITWMLFRWRATARRVRSTESLRLCVITVAPS